MTGATSAAAKTWGPFTGRQLTVIIVSLITVAFFPSAAWAVDTFSNVAIQDPVSGVKAAVDSSRRLQVNGSVSGSTVYALPRPPSTPWSFSQATPPTFVAIAGPSAVPINVTSLSVGIQFGSYAEVTLFVYAVPLASTVCGANNPKGNLYQIGHLNSAAGPFAVEFPTPLVARPAASEKICVWASVGGDSTITLNASGYHSG